ncbi:ankyrin repeat protein [Cordyceps javanica]|uniref:Ankyrin repeat protein n=1 Tax=Cordyceps javanica TaxID=43265 RepID=A0A545UR07_9HYPO|nr:ankyrin repeat protein [Cordyceps javanica]
MLKFTSFKLDILICLGFFARAARADNNDDFINNLLTDLAPLIALFGERVVMQFMSQSMGWADCVALAVAPIGVITIIVSAIRVAGPTWLKAIIGRARENLSTAEIELMSSTSTEACELWNGRNVVRCPGSGQILQFVCLVPKIGPYRGTADGIPWEAVCMPLKQAGQSGLLRKTDISDSVSDSVPVIFSACSMISRIFGSNGTQSSTGDIESGSPGQLPVHNDQQSEQKNRRSHDSGRPSDSNSQHSEQESRRSYNSSRSSDSSSQQSEQESQRSYNSGRPSDSNSQQSDNSSQSEAASPTTSKIVIIRDEDDAAPNVSLNCHNRHSRYEIILVAVFGVLVQVAVLIYCGFATRSSSLRSNLLKDGKPVKNYAFPLTVSGTIVLTIGVFICGIVVERSTNESYYKPNHDYDAYVVWLQKDSKISDQEFKPCAIYPTSRRTVITTSRRSTGVQNSDSAQQPGQGHASAITTLKLFTTIGCLVSLSGFALQFMGLRGSNYTVSIAQFLAMAIMTILRAVVRRGLVEAPEHERLSKGFELDWLASSLRDSQPEWMARKEDRDRSPETAQVIGPEAGPDSENQNSSESSQKEELRASILGIRRQLGNFVNWRGPALNQAVLLSKALKVVGSELLGRGKERYEFHAFPQENNWKLKFSLEHKPGKWEAPPDHIEAAISLWMSFSRTPGVLAVSDEKQDRFRAQRTQRLGLRILGKSSQSHVLMRNLQFHIPANLSASIPEILRVEKKSPVQDEGRSTLEAISTYHVVGCGREDFNSFSNAMTASARSFNFSKGRFSMDAPKSKHTRTGAGRQPEPATEPAHQDIAASPVRDHKDLDIAVYFDDDLERLFARQIFFAFMKSLSAADVHWGEGPSEIVAENEAGGWRYDWQNLKINNQKVSDLVAKIHGTGFLSLEEAYFDVVAPLSLSNALPGNSAVLDYTKVQVSQCIKDSKFFHLQALLERLFHLAMAFNNNASDCMARAISIYQYYDDFAKYLMKIATKEERVFPYDMGRLEEKSIRPFEAEKGTDDLSTLCNVFTGQFSMWSNLSGFDFSKKGRPDGERVKAFNLTKSHTWALGISSEYPADEDGSSWLKKDIFGWTPIHYWAASGQHAEDLRFRFPFGDLEGIQDQFDFTPLHYACIRGDEKMVQVLLDKGAPIEAQQLDGISPLHIAATKSDSRMLDLLLQTAQTRDYENRQTLFIEAKKDEPLTRLVGRLTDFDDRAAVHWAAIHGNLDAVKMLKQNLSLKDRYGWNCLHLAVMHERYELVKYLMTEDELDLNATGNDGYTPLHLAIRRKETAMIRLLIEKRASINTVTIYGDMPFHEAIDKCELSVIESLIENGAEFNNQKNVFSRGSTLYCAIERGNLDILDRLLQTDEGQKACLVKTTDGYTPLHAVVVQSHVTAPEMAKMISKYLDGDVNPKDGNGRTPLHSAVDGGNLALIRTLLDLGATESLFLSDKWGETPLDIAKAEFVKQMNVKPGWGDKGKDWTKIVDVLENYEGYIKTGRIAARW